jgi:serine/threonine protein kinase
MSLPSGTQLGPYEILSPIGAGGMGEVYRARDSRLGRTVAIKVLPPDSLSKPERVARFEQEAKAASARNHPNILTIYDIGQSGETRYIAMEFVEGETVRQLIRIGSLPIKKALDIAAQAAGALAAAHAAGIVHRDIKPENIMVRTDGYVKVLDFGLAKLAEPPLGSQASDPNAPTATVVAAMTEPGRVLGTWLYMSPEQARGQELDGRTDVWSLGTVLYEMVAGKCPFAAKTLTDTLAAILNREPEPITDIRNDVPTELDHILAKSLAKEREDRYQSIQDMALDLKQLRKSLDSDPAAVRSRTIHSGAAVVQQTSSPSRRGNAAPLIFSLLAVAAAVAVVLLIWAMKRQPKAAFAPERRLAYSLLVQKMRDGKPYQEPFRASGREIFENGWKVKFDFSLPQPGSLYLLNDGPGANGVPALALVFPTPSVNNGSAQVMAYQHLQSGWLVFNDSPGKEKFWIVWADKPVAELEQAVTQVARTKNAVIADARLDAAIRSDLGRSAPVQVSVDQDSKLTTVSGRGELLVSGLELEHR